MVDKELQRNGSGYYDGTAYLAIINYLKSEDKRMDVYAGDILKAKTNNGYEKIFVVLSVHNNFSTTLMLSDDERLPYAIPCGCMMFTNPGMLQYTYNDNFIEFIRSLKKEEFEDILQEVVDALGYKAKTNVVAAKKPVIIEHVADVKPIDNASEELTKAKAERDVYKSLYENLISTMFSKQG